MKIFDRFVLTNEQRKYLGLDPIEDHFEPVQFDQTIYFFDGDTIKKEICSRISEDNSFTYLETKLDIKTSENRTLVLPKTQRGKAKKLTPVVVDSFSPPGLYFSFNSFFVNIGNYTTQKTFYYETFDYEKFNKNKTVTDFQNWLSSWIKDTKDSDLIELETFKNEKRVHQKYKEGDIFVFKIGRREYGFGKILIDVKTRRKTEEFKKIKTMVLNS